MSENGKHYSVSEKLEIVKAKQSGLNVDDVAAIFGCGTTSVNLWTKAYQERGLAGLENEPQGRPQALAAKTEAAEQLVDALQKENPEAGISKIQGLLFRRGLLKIARETVRGILRRHGHKPQTQRFRRKNPPKKPRYFESANPNDMWQTDIMTFMLKGQYRVYVMAFIDDHSRFIVGWGLYRLQTAANVIEVLHAAVEKHGMPKELLSDNGRQYYTWRGRSSFGTLLLKMGIRHIRSRPYHPQTLGKIESFWRNLLQECLEITPLQSFEDAKDKIQAYIEHYNHKRPHQGIGNMTPADRYFRVADQVNEVVEENSRRVEQHEPPANYTPPSYIVGNIAGKELRVVAKDAEVSLRETEGGSEKGGANESNRTATGATESASSDSAAVEGKAAKPAGAAGVGPAGADPGADGGEAVRASGGVEGVVLPVDETGQGKPAEGAGGQKAGPQTPPEAAGGSSGDPGAAGTAPTDGAGGGGAAQGTGSPSEDDGSGAAGDPKKRLESGTDETGS